MLDPDYQSRLHFQIARLKSEGIEFGAGLSAEEFASLEDRYGFRFPPDLRWFLAQGLPVTDRFPRWRGADEAIRERLDWPLEGILFDIEQNNYWRAEWGPRPASLAEALAAATEQIRQAPVLLPIYAHVYVPALPCAARNPIFSVYQTDIIHRGRDIAEYLAWFLHDEDDDDCAPPCYAAEYPYVPFWTELARENNEGWSRSEESK